MKRGCIFLSGVFHRDDELWRRWMEYLRQLGGHLATHNYDLVLLNQNPKSFEFDLLVESLAALPANAVPETAPPETCPPAILAQAVHRESCLRQISPERARTVLSNQARRFSELCRRHQPRLVVLSVQFTGLHEILAALATAEGIPVWFSGSGVLPGTVVFEPGGQMANSYVTTRNAEFQALPVTDEDLARADTFLTTARSERLNRKAQPVGLDAATQAALAREGRGRIFFAGHNDAASGNCHLDAAARAWHSPVFTGTYEALNSLVPVAAAKQLQLLFKAHPNVPAPVEPQLHSQSHFLWAQNKDTDIYACIDATDVTVTILSQASYMAMIAGKPVVMLGRNQMTGKGCAYEALTREAIEPALDRALSRDGFGEMQLHWRAHVARLLRYHLFGYDERVLALGTRRVSMAAELLARHAR